MLEFANHSEPTSREGSWNMTKYSGWAVWLYSGIQRGLPKGRYTSTCRIWRQWNNRMSHTWTRWLLWDAMRPPACTKKVTYFSSKQLFRTSALMAASSSVQSEYICSLALEDDEDEEATVKLRRLKNQRTTREIIEIYLSRIVTIQISRYFTF